MSVPQAPSKLETFLRSRHFILCIVIFSVLYLTPNTFFVYFEFMDSFPEGWRQAVSAGVAILVASGIMIYTVRGNIRVASYYMWFEISISAYYYITTVGWDWGLIPAFSFVFMLPVSLKNYAKELESERDLYDEFIKKEKPRENIELISTGNFQFAQPEKIENENRFNAIKDEKYQYDKLEYAYELLISESKDAIAGLEEKNRALYSENQLLSHQIESMRIRNTTEEDTIDYSNQPNTVENDIMKGLF